jgi:hypothetical protein
MLHTLAFVAALSAAPAQAGDLSLTNVRTTYGPVGVVRKDSTLLPGDHVFITFDIEGIAVGADGKVLYSMTTEVLDGKGKVLHKQEPRDLETINALGGNTAPAYAQLDVGLDTPAGDYTVRVTVTDRASRRSQALTRKFTVAPPAFGIARVTTTSDPEGQVFTSLFQAGGSLWVNFGAVGIARDRTTMQPKVAFELQVLDDGGNPTMAKPFHGEVSKDVPPKAAFVPGQFLVSLNRAGKFTVKLKATDQVTGKTSEMSFPITVLPAAK